ncbi:O-methyltransferase [Hominifimenecus sp. rT4P-3]|uniref:O-methyltransferase n=1 Tax=Hominifimenecus sp. rT4P-3 TaxID=3242979 RepID=UPI003DA387E3
MMDQERLRVYLSSLEQTPSPLIEEIEAHAAANFVPIIRKETAALLKTLIALKQPKEILEVGTATGYSALRMCEALRKDGKITTIEKYEKRIPIAQENFRRAGEEDRITLIEGDAAKVLATLAGPYDFIFMDAAKGQYLAFLPDVLRLLPEGGVLVTDNVFQDGTLLESRYAVSRRDRTIHARLREYLYELKHREDLETAVVPVGDGVTISVKVASGGKRDK